MTASENAATLSNSGNGIALEPIAIDGRPETRPVCDNGFDYDAFGGNVTTDLRATATRIRARLANSVIETGRDLLEVKERLPHGDFIRWVEAECLITSRTAQNMMTAARWVEGKSETVSHLQPTLIYLLSAPSTPTNIQAEFVARIESGECVSADAARAEIAAAREAKREAEREAAKLARQTPEGKAWEESRAAREQRQLASAERKYQKEQERRAKAHAAIGRILIEDVSDLDRLYGLLLVAGHDELALPLQEHVRGMCDPSAVVL